MDLLICVFRGDLLYISSILKKWLFLAEIPGDYKTLKINTP
jgi:hypothetical protein